MIQRRMPMVMKLFIMRYNILGWDKYINIGKRKLKRSSCWPGGTEGQYEDRVVRQEDISMGINPALDYLSMPSSVEIKAGAATEN